MNPSAPLMHLLWLDPFRPLGEAERSALAAAGLAVQAVSTLEQLNERLPQADAIALRLEGGITLMQDVQALLTQAAQRLPLICRVERRELELAVAAMQQGARHVLAADEFSGDAWLGATQGATPGVSSPQAAPAKPQAPRTVVYVDPASRHLLALAQRVARAPVSVLVEGPTGAGKEVLARVLHEASPRARGPFVALNCAALPDHLIEDMLFGHEKGAFTGALKEHRGLFEQAQGGTVFLDEIAEMPLHLQAKLLRVLQERQLVRLGGERPLDLDVRVVAATNRDLRACMAQREFREDLYFRLSTFKLRVPPLRERPGDILPLVARLLVRFADGGRVHTLSPEAQARLLQHAWPGNVRELENVVMRALVLCTGDVITPAHLMFDEPAHQAPAAPPMHEPAPPAVAATPDAAAQAASPGAVHPATCDFQPTFIAPAIEAEPANLQQAVQMNEQQLIMAALQSTYSRMEAARKLGISPRTLRYKLAKLKGSGLALGV